MGQLLRRAHEIEMKSCDGKRKGRLAIPAQQAGRSELLALWAGQSAGIAQHRDVKTLLQSLVNEVSEKLAWTAP